MNISLRKSNAVQNQITDALRHIEIKTDVSINEFQDPEVEIANGQKSLLENDRRRGLLLAAQYNIRGLVGAANAQSGIDLLLILSSGTTQGYIYKCLFASSKKLGQASRFEVQSKYDDGYTFKHASKLDLPQEKCFSKFSS
jgi:hypothetical protein